MRIIHLRARLKRSDHHKILGPSRPEPPHALRPETLFKRALSRGPLDTHDAAVGAPCRAWTALTAERIRSPADYLERVRG